MDGDAQGPTDAELREMLELVTAVQDTRAVRAACTLAERRVKALRVQQALFTARNVVMRMEVDAAYADLNRDELLLRLILHDVLNNLRNL